MLDSLALRAKMIHGLFDKIEGIHCNPLQGAMYAFPRLDLPKSYVKKAQVRGCAFFLLADLFGLGDIYTNMYVAGGVRDHPTPTTHTWNLGILCFTPLQCSLYVTRAAINF